MLGLAVEHQDIAEGLRREGRQLQQMAQLSEATCWVAVHVEQCAVVQRDLRWQHNHFCHRNSLACNDSESKHISIINLCYGTYALLSYFLGRLQKRTILLMTAWFK